VTKVGVIITAIYIFFIGFLCWSSLPTLTTIPLNEFGDFFAGVFGPLMLFWLILGYVQQQKELQQNTKALELQADELKKSVEQHKELVKATKEQVQTDIKALEIEQNRHQKEGHPNFTITNAGWSSSLGQNIKFDINLLNSGKPASEVSFTTTPEIPHLKGLGVIHYFPDKHKHQLSWKTDESGDAPEELRIVVSCNDSNSRPYAKVFELKLNENNKYHLIRVQDVS